MTNGRGIVCVELHVLIAVYVIEDCRESIGGRLFQYNLARVRGKFSKMTLFEESSKVFATAGSLGQTHDDGLVNSSDFDATKQEGGKNLPYGENSLVHVVILDPRFLLAFLLELSLSPSCAP